MPAGAASAFVAGLFTDERPDFPHHIPHGWNELPLSGLPRLPTSLYDVRCAAGFRCVSSVKKFGLGHDGVYEKPATEGIDPRFQEAFEWGCPARGVVSSGGECKDTGEGAESKCFSTTRYEAGPGTACGDSDDNCFCVKATTPNGSAGRNLGSEVVAGQEILQGVFKQMPAVKCDDCSQHSCDAKMCSKCENCEYTTKMLDGRRTLGCFDSDEGGQGQEKTDGREYLEGNKPEDRNLYVVPHYRFWDPGDDEEPATTDDVVDESNQDQAEESATLAAGQRMPYQSRREPVSRQMWLSLYKDAGPRIQYLLDGLVNKLKGEWAAEPKRLACYSPNGDGGHDVAGKMEKVLAAQRTCRYLQETSMTLSRGGKESQFPVKDEDGHQVECDKDQNGEYCEGLNCYTSDPEVTAAIQALKKRNVECKEAFTTAKVAASRDEQDLEDELTAGSVNPETVKHLEEEGAPGGPITEAQLQASNDTNASEVDAENDANANVVPGANEQSIPPNTSAMPLAGILLCVASTNGRGMQFASGCSSGCCSGASQVHPRGQRSQRHAELLNFLCV